MTCHSKMNLKFVVTHAASIYKAMYPTKKNKYEVQLKEYIRAMGLSLRDPAHKLFDNVVLKLNYHVPTQYREAMLFAINREMVEHWMIARYTHEVYEAFKIALTQHPDSSNNTHD